MAPGMNEFFDINKFKPGKGILWFPISLARIDNAQSAKMYFEDYISHLTPSKVVTPTLGANFCYGEWLYMWDNEAAAKLKKSYTISICRHKNSCASYIWKPQVHLGKTDHDSSYYIPSAFNFNSWASLYRGYEKDFSSDLTVLYNIYKKDELFQKYLLEDCKKFDREPTENQIMFFLEEHLIMYFIAKGAIKLYNEYVPNHDRVLICYPGIPPKHFIYIMQQNFFKLTDDKNAYAQNYYNLTNKKLYDFTRIDLETYNYE